MGFWGFKLISYVNKPPYLLSNVSNRQIKISINASRSFFLFNKWLEFENYIITKINIDG